MSPGDEEIVGVGVGMLVGRGVGVCVGVSVGVLVGEGVFVGVGVGIAESETVFPAEIGTGLITSFFTRESKILGSGEIPERSVIETVTISKIICSL